LLRTERRTGGKTEKNRRKTEKNRNFFLVFDSDKKRKEREVKKIFFMGKW
jgi:hypothetical protein